MAVRDQVQLLLWRAGLGATPAQVDAATSPGYMQAVENVVTATSTPASPPLPPWPTQLPPNATPEQKIAYSQAINDANNQGITTITNWWTNLLRTSDAPLQEHLALFWHNHFATSNDKVRRPPYMLGQNTLFRSLGAGKFEDLLVAVSKDPAMLIWLDNQTNVKAHPNENWAREVMELFTLGIGNYTESDVREAARACTGWTLSYDGVVAFVASRFDSNSKTILGQTGNFTMDDFSHMLATHPATATHICTKLFAWFCGDAPTAGNLAPLLNAWNATGGEIRSVLRALFLSDAFLPANATTAHMKNPISWTFGLLRSLGLTATDATVANALSAQGMPLFRPPNVGGWPTGTAWISPDDQLLRYNLAGQFIATATIFAGQATSAFLAQLADQLGGIVIPADVQTKLLTLGSGTDGQRAVAQVVLAGPDYQAW
ncbi:MAG: DUF1800 domain-containing protein [Chloroflexota bacterium]|nr:DUF1800 domain-containing protein [Chloroflexota bacterium]MDQ6908115.1 DUF1800 domain-containing protein [Chloroflexota bacterium]